VLIFHFLPCRLKRFIRVRGRVVGWWLVLRIIVLGIGTRLSAGEERSGESSDGAERNGWWWGIERGGRGVLNVSMQRFLQRVMLAFRLTFMK